MELIAVLNRCHHYSGFVYQRASFGTDKKSIEVSVRPRKGSAAICSRCHQPAATTNSPNVALSFGEHPKPANEGQLKTGQ
jgi:hypothetical protein